MAKLIFTVWRMDALNAAQMMTVSELFIYQSLNTESQELNAIVHIYA